jgi:phosphoribosylformimino-5-aminoimidazole carboxamide ribotide isomerase
MLILPAIDLRNGAAVRLLQGRKEAATVYDSDPIERARSFAAAGAPMIHVVDLDGAFAETNSRNREVLREIVTALAVPVQFGGGLRTRDAVASAFDIGVFRVVLGTMAVEAPALLGELVGAFGGERIVAGIDARDGQVMTRGWEQHGGTPALELARRVAAAGVQRIVYTDVARDGMLTGPNFEQTRAIARESGLKITASGGVSSLADIDNLLALEADGVDSVIVGKALYEGRFTVAQALRICER